MGLAYDYPEKQKACSEKPLTVKYDGRAFGEIRKVKDGYQFFAKDDKTGGPVLSNVPEVQNSLIALQPSKEERKGGDAKEKETPDDQSSGMIKKIKKELKSTNATLENAIILLTASFDLLEKQSASEKVLNVLEENIRCGEIEVDGHSLFDDIGKFLEDA